jgi:sialidase-1
MPESSRYDSVIAEASEQFPRNSEGSVVRLKNGDLLVAWSAFERDIQDDTEAHIRARISNDDGDTWGEPFVLLENSAAQNTMSVSFLRESSGALLMAVLEKQGPNECNLVVRKALQEPYVWSGPTRVTQSPGYYVMNNDRFYEDGAGRIYAPVAVSQGEVWTDADHFTCHVWFSDDGGASWTRSRGEIDLPDRGAMEPGLIESPRGLSMIIRSQLGQIYVSRSTNRGWTWSEPLPLGVESPEAPATIGELPDGRQALVYNPDWKEGESHGGPRTPLHIASSSDHGETWESVADLESNHDLSFSYASWLVDNDRIFITYYVGEKDSSRISLKFSRLETDWFK